MSKIFDALKQAESARARGNRQLAERRRSPRVRVQITLFVYGYSAGSIPFHEEACTISMNAHGGLLCMRTAVPPGQRLLLTNRHNDRTQECRVVLTEERFTLGVAVAFEFPAPMPHFWRDLEIGLHP